MSKFKVGDRVRLLSDAWSCARKESGPEPRFGRAGEVGVIVEDGGTSDGLKGWWVGEVGEFARGWFADEQLTHADQPQPPVAHHDRVVADTHAAIDRLVAHLERQATEHVHALDALRAEVESLRTQNAHLRNQLAELYNGLRGMDRLTQRVAEVEAENAHLRALQAAGEAKPVREVVRGTYDGRHAIAQPGHKPGGECGRTAIGWEDGWSTYIDGNLVECQCLTEAQAIAWVLDGVLPTR